MARRGDLVVYLFACWPELQSQLSQWGRIVATIGCIWAVLEHPMLCLGLYVAYRYIKGQQ